MKLYNSKGRKKLKGTEPWHAIKKNVTQYNLKKFGDKKCATTMQIRDLWYRDKAYEMKNPRIQRIKLYVPYIMSNLKFIHDPMV